MAESASGRYRLRNGLQLNLISDPSLSQGAAVFTVANGSHQEPDQWPGLAHLTEHLLFSGGQNYLGQQRLMPWVKQQAGHVNATTRQNVTAYYFDVDSHLLTAGLERLMDMLTSPRFSLDAIDREARIIDEEFQLICQNPQAQVAAVIQGNATAPTALQRFRIGNLAHFGQDLDALSAALDDFYKRHYPFADSTLWVMSPNTLDELQQQVVQALALSEPLVLDKHPPLASPVKPLGELQMANWQGEIELDQVNGACLTAIVKGAHLSCWTIFEQLVTDNAPGSFHDCLTKQLASDHRLRIERIGHDSHQLWFTLWIEGEALTAEQGRQLLALWRQWLSALALLDSDQLAHYQHLAEQALIQLPLMEQLRERAFGFYPQTGQALLAWSELIIGLRDNSATALLYLRRSLPTPRQQFLGLPVKFAHLGQLVTELPNLNPHFYFYPQPQPRALTPLSDQLPIPLHHCHTSSESYSLLLRPAAGQTLSLAAWQQLTTALAPVVSLAKHYAGNAAWQQVAGQDYLFFRFNQYAKLQWMVEALISHWPLSTDSRLKTDDARLPLRQFLEAVPRLLVNSSPVTHWIASLDGGHHAEQQHLARQLGRMPINWQPVSEANQQPDWRHHYWQSEQEARLVAFVPYPATTLHQLAQYRRLARLYEPAFYRQLREKQAVGYAVACRERFFSDRFGLQLILQSQHYSLAQLRQLIDDFFAHFRLEAEALPNLNHDMSVTSTGNSQFDRHLQQLKEQMDLRLTDDLSAPCALTNHQLHNRLVTAVIHRQGGWLESGI